MSCETEGFPPSLVLIRGGGSPKEGGERCVKSNVIKAPNGHFGAQVPNEVPKFFYSCWNKNRADDLFGGDKQTPAL